MGGQSHTAGRWVYTSAIAKFEGDSERVRAYSGSIHAGWEDGPEFETSEQFYDWAKAECAKRNLLEAAAPELLDAAKRLIEANDRITDQMMRALDPADARRIAERGSAEFSETLEPLRAAISKATGESAA